MMCLMLYIVIVDKKVQLWLYVIYSNSDNNDNVNIILIIRQLIVDIIHIFDTYYIIYNNDNNSKNNDNGINGIEKNYWSHTILLLLNEIEYITYSCQSWYIYYM